MSKNQSPALRLKALITAFAVIGTLLFGVAAPASASPAATSISVAAVHTAVPAQINGTTVCSVAATGGYKNWMVAGFALGYCPTWGFFQTPWGKTVARWVTNVGCWMPWFVWAATGGRATRC